MCRREIPPDYLEHPDLVQGPLEAEVAEESPEVQVREDEEDEDQAEGDAGNSRLDESRFEIYKFSFRIWLLRHFDENSLLQIFTIKLF